MKWRISLSSVNHVIVKKYWLVNLKLQKGKFIYVHLSNGEKGKISIAKVNSVECVKLNQELQYNILVTWIITVNQSKEGHF